MHLSHERVGSYRAQTRHDPLDLITACDFPLDKGRVTLYEAGGSLR
jgi:hypothetical protein